ncbi:FAD-binding and (Fe-S)-binding domain-containing protein [Flagellimonas zhangzhouensis]|uniref:FAD/FMN-containing dehydrogenase n=1 Tax=Flagellimonas zhangzhouensis TaxID=1073328 RepID=A0A1H2SDE9_9FLAO|nr:FAD-binding and (Fe-S)-binding domain-containing protein [Allomuricauda zhangzhouensis]SDQ73473.1 FAD/FMN-containing dehydrogenase [Allomuricauda zhangzhouensis]SDW29518.1 FAD/FMN-containing dehydrogenase [Allomuricauda zhangzhouensis]
MDKNLLKQLDEQLQGELLFDNLTKAIYATDASVYRKLPVAVAYPKDNQDLKTLIGFANSNKVGLIPRTAGTSLAGQCVGDGIVVDVSRYFTQIIGLDKDKKQVTVQPGVVRDELNQFLKPFGLFFGPNTSTANRCMIGGMVGNNSSGTTSIQYGVTRDKVVAMQCILSDGSDAQFSEISKKEFQEKKKGESLKAKIYSKLYEELSNPDTQNQIHSEFPKPSIHRRNTGYAVDELLKNNVFSEDTEDFNLCKLLSGSEGTLAFTTEITLQLDDLPPSYAAMVATHYKTLEDCLSDVAPVMQHSLHLCEMMDKVILDCTKNNRAQLANRFFVEGDPAGILMLELKADSEEDLEKQLTSLLKTIEKSGLSYANPILYGDDINKAIELRKAGLGLLGNMVGDRKAVACIEDTAVALEDLKDFIMEFSKIMESYNQDAVYYAHAGAGELHLRPILNLKKSEDVVLFRSITTDVAKLTKKYHGSFSGEHGDGIVRAEFIPLMIGKANYELLKRVKTLFDPNGIFNPGKIVDAYPMDESLRYEIDREEPEVKTFMDFTDSEGILKAAEKCNGSGDCRKSHEMKGGMCPSYQATKDEKDTTRGRANALREFLTNSEKTNRFDHEELKSAFDLCLSCKACASECPSNVDVSTLKAEFLYNYQEANGYSLRSKLFAHNTQLNALGSKMSGLTNAVYDSGVLGGLLKKASGVAPERSLPKVYKFNFDAHLEENKVKHTDISKPRVVLYIDEFVRYLDIEVGKDAIELLCKLGYEVELFYAESGRTYLSKGFLKQAKKLVAENMESLKPYLDEKVPIVGLEPSAILSFRDEYQRLHDDKPQLEKLATQSFLLEEFLAAQIAEGHITADKFTEEERTVKIHNHCHQKALSNQKVTFDVLNLPKNYKVTIIASGCCGMAGSFGYEKEHYETSMKVGGLKLFPAVEKSPEDTLIAANGTSCRHQIKDGTKREAQHPVSILRQALVI